MPMSRGLPFADLMQQAVLEHHREISELQALHQRELQALQHEISALKEQSHHQVQPRTPHIQNVGHEGDKVVADADEHADTTVSEHYETEESTPNPQRAKRRNHKFHSLVSREDMMQSRSSCRKFVEGPFDNFVCFVIVLNGIFLFYQQQYLGEVQGAKIGIGADTRSRGMDIALFTVEHVLNTFFLLEVTIRVVVLGRDFFHEQHFGNIQFMNMFDLVLVVATSVDLYLHSSDADGGVMNFNIFRPLRFLRVTRFMRIGKSMHLFFKLRILVSTVICSVIALFWSIVLLIVTMLIVSLVISQLVGMHLEDDSISLERRVWMYDTYGTSTKAYWSLFELTFSGGWPTYVRPLVEDVSPWWSIFFFVYIVIVQFAMFRIITALFLRDTLALAANDAETAVQEKLRMQEDVGEKLLDFFHEADKSKDGALSLAEFKAMLENPKVCAWLSLLEVEIRDAMQAFQLVGGKDDGMVDADEFVKGMTRIKGLARSQDILEVMRTLNELKKMVETSGGHVRVLA